MSGPVSPPVLSYTVVYLRSKIITTTSGENWILITENDENCLYPAQEHSWHWESMKETKRKHYFIATFMNKLTKEKQICFLSSVSMSFLPHHLLAVHIERCGCWCRNVACTSVCAFPTYSMCVSPLWPPLICQGVLVRVAVSSIHICASARRLNICHQTVNVRNRRCLFVCVCVFR